MSRRFVTYFEVIYANTIAGYTCGSQKKYEATLQRLSEQYPELELVYREWSDGTIEDGTTEKEDWYNG